MKNNKLKFNFLIIFCIFFMAFFSIFIVYIYYRISINPKPNITETVSEVIINDSEKQNKITFYNDITKINDKSVFDIDLKITETLNNSPLKSLKINNVNLPLNEDFIKEKKLNILRYLYSNDIENAINMASQIANNYSFKDYREFEVFIYEVLERESLLKLTNKEKIDILKNTLSPELILYSYLTLDINSRNDITKNKQSVIFDEENLSPDFNLIYENNLTAGLYSEMDINNAFFTIPKNIDGYKIEFKFNNAKYKLYYIRYKDNNKIDIILLENLSNSTNPIIKNYK